MGVIKIGNKKAKNVLVIEPGTSGGGAYFVPLAKWLNELAPEWQVWAVERRENLLEEQKVLDKFKAGQGQRPGILQVLPGLDSARPRNKHYQPVNEPEAVKDGGREWGMAVAVEDLHVVIEAAKKLGGKVVLAGHSLGGSVVTAYATWDFAGKPGAEGLSGLVFIDGGSSPTPISAEEAGKRAAQTVDQVALAGVRGHSLADSRAVLDDGLGAGRVRTEGGIGRAGLLAAARIPADAQLQRRIRASRPTKPASATR